MEPGRQTATNENYGLEVDERREPYLSPILYTYGRIDDMTEYAGASSFDGIVGNSTP